LLGNGVPDSKKELVFSKKVRLIFLPKQGGADNK